MEVIKFTNSRQQFNFFYMLLVRIIYMRREIGGFFRLGPFVFASIILMHSS